MCDSLRSIRLLMSVSEVRGLLLSLPSPRRCAADARMQAQACQFDRVVVGVLAAAAVLLQLPASGGAAPSGNASQMAGAMGGAAEGALRWLLNVCATGETRHRVQQPYIRQLTL